MLENSISTYGECINPLQQETASGATKRTQKNTTGQKTNSVTQTTQNMVDTALSEN